MKKQVLAFFIFFISLTSFSQDIIQPIKEITYGNLNHTNRDYLRTTLVDKKDNIYLIGETENDFTFNDIKIIKLDKNLNVLFEIVKSFDYGISYDGVLGAHIDSNNNFIIICRAAYTSHKQTFIVLKYNENGKLLWELPLSDISNPIDYSFYSYSSFLDASDNLNLKYRPVNQNTVEFFFLTISPNGQKIEEYSNSDLFINRRFKLLNNKGTYNMISVEDISSEPYQKFMLHKFSHNSKVSYNLNLDKEATGYFNTPFAETWTIMKKDNNDNLVLLAPSYRLYKDYGILNVNPDGTLKYKIFPDKINDKYPLEFGFDDQNNLIIISNNRKSNTSDPLKITIQKYNQKGELFFESTNSYIGKYVSIKDFKISVLTDSNQVINFDFDFNIIDKIQLNPINTYNFSVNNLFSIDSNYYLSGQTEDVNYNGSVLLSEIDMYIKKMNNLNEINSYTFSGKGTSKVFKRKELIVRDTAYAFAIIEKTGPDNFSPNGSIAPEKQRFVTINKKNLTIVEDKEVPLSEILYTPYYKKKMITKYKALNGDQYDYVIKSDTTQVSLYKNNSLQWTRNLSLYMDPKGNTVINDNEKIFDWKVNKKGDFLLTTHIYGLKKCTLHKYSIENNYSKLTFNELLLSVVPMTNNWLFTINQSGYVTIFSDRLTVINKTNSPIYSNLSPFSFFIKERNNQVLINKHREKIIKTFNQFGEVQQNYFEINTDLNHSNNPHIEYDNNFLVVMEQIGQSIYLSPEYSWLRLVIKKYNLDISETFGEISIEDDDNDGVTNNIDECRNTPTNESVNLYGCSKSQTLSIDHYYTNSITSIYPNPVKDNFSFTLKHPLEIKSIEIFDYTGKRVLIITNKKIIGNQKIKFTNHKRGFYILKINFVNNSSLNKKFIVK